MTRTSVPPTDGMDADQNLLLGEWVAVITASKTARSSTERAGPTKRWTRRCTWRSKAVMSSIAQVLSESSEQSLEAAAST
jgi:hypothetical protein